MDKNTQQWVEKFKRIKFIVLKVLGYFFLALWILIWVLIAILIIITIIKIFPILSDYIKDYYAGKITIEVDKDIPNVKDLLYYIVYAAQLLVAGVFSYLVWKTTLANNELTKDLATRSQSEKIQENKLIVYYDLLLGLNDLEKLYICIRYINTRDLNPKRLYFSNEWIKNAANLCSIFDNEELNKVYELYGELHTIKYFLENRVIEEINLAYQISPLKSYVYDDSIYDSIISLFDKVFDETMWNDQRPKEDPTTIINYLKSTYRIIMGKLELREET